MKEIYGVDLRILAAVIVGFFVGIFVHQKIISRTLLVEETMEVAEAALQNNFVVIALILVIAAAWIISSLKAQA